VGIFFHSHGNCPLDAWLFSTIRHYHICDRSGRFGDRMGCTLKFQTDPLPNILSVDMPRSLSERTRVKLPVTAGSNAPIRRNDRLARSPSRQSVEHFRQTRLVGIAHGGFAIWFDPFGMVDPQIAVNLLLEFGVCVDWKRQDHQPRYKI
jgi:hypothetical protein